MLVVLINHNIYNQLTRNCNKSTQIFLINCLFHDLCHYFFNLQKLFLHKSKYCSEIKLVLTLEFLNFPVCKLDGETKMIKVFKKFAKID